MSRNRIKIICNSQANTLSYRFQNEQKAWVPVSTYSDLAKGRYTETNIRQSAAMILNIIGTVYNPGNRGVEISFEGPEKDYRFLQQIIREKFSKENISCEQKAVKAAVAGRRSSGKTTLIEAMAQKQGIRYTAETKAGYRRYKSASNEIEWFEIEGIDIGLENVMNAERTIEVLSKQGLTTLLYCLSSDRVEQAEIQLIQHIRDRCPEISILGVLTNAGSQDAAAEAETVSRFLGAKVLPIMAKDRKTRSGIIKAFGHENVLRAIFGEE